MTGARIAIAAKKYLGDSEHFGVTYGDGLSNQNLRKLYNFHLSHGKISTLTAVRPPARYGELALKDNIVKKFEEKPIATKSWINGGFFVFNSKIFQFIKNDKTVLEKHPLEILSKKGELRAYKHGDFWQCMDTMRDKILLNKLWNEGNALWKK